MPHIDYTITIGQLGQTFIFIIGAVVAVIKGIRTFDRLSNSVSNLTHTVNSLSDQMGALTDRMENFGENIHKLDKRVTVVENKF